MTVTIETPAHLGEMIRAERKRQRILQRDLADLSGVSLHFLSNLENGKPTIEFQKVLWVLRSLGIELTARTRHHQGSK